MLAPVYARWLVTLGILPILLKHALSSVSLMEINNSIYLTE